MADNTAVYTGTGRRKEATARVRLVPGTGKVTVNGRDALNYFGRQQLVDNALAPFRVTDTEGHFDVIALCDGGGINGQSGALRLGIARALLTAGEYRADLKKAAEDAKKQQEGGNLDINGDGEIDGDDVMQKLDESKKTGDVNAFMDFVNRYLELIAE